VYFGTSEGAPRFRIQKYFADVHNDFASDVQPFDKQYLGMTGLVSGDFTRWRNDLWLQMLSAPNPTGTPGLNPGGDLGTFMQQEGMTYQVWMQNPYSAKAAMSGLEAGIHFLSTFLIGPEEKVVGTRTNKVRVSWFALGVFVPDVGNTVREKLYDFNMSGLPGIS